VCERRLMADDDVDCDNGIGSALMLLDVKDSSLVE
jgi:hypothetical protein